MSWRSLGGTLLAPLALSACGALVRVPDLPPVPEDVLGHTFAPEELCADVDELLELLEEIHPDPYRTLPREQALERRKALVEALDRPLTRSEFQPLLAELVAALGDGHTSVYLPEEFWREGAASSFPIDVAWDTGAGLAVRRTAAVTPDGSLAPGARLLAIGSTPAEELFADFLTRQSGESETWRVAAVEQAFPVHLWLAGVRAPFRLQVQSALDPALVFEVDLPGMPFGAVGRGAAPGGGEPWRLERRDDGVALLVLDTFSRHLPEFERFLERTFAELAERPPTALAVDLRRNGGGDSRLGDELLQYLSDAPWRQAARKEWKVSATLKKHLKSMLPAWLRWIPVWYLHPMGRKLWGTPEGQIAVFDQERVTPRSEPLRYRGPLAWLIGPHTFSSAMGLAAGAQDCGRGILVGAETGGVANGFGEVYAFRLARTRLGAQISTASFVRSDGDPGACGGVRPDVAVWPTPGKSGDPVLAAAIEELLGAASTDA